MPTSTRRCPDCQSELADSNRFCPSCGARTPQYTAAAGSPPPAGSVTTEAAHRERLQRALGNGWQITRLIGRGGFAEVYAALDVNLRREVAVKTLRHDLEVSAPMLQRFRREAESVARLRHPNIVPIYQVGEGEGIVYFIMPVIEGESLANALIRGGSFSIKDTMRVLREVAGALGAAHRMGVVHRDVKPDNIMLEGPERRAVVMDFGIAKLADAAEARLTGTGLLIGSPHYMSPEQAAGESQLDQRSDEYSLAVVGYQMLAGRMPFEATSVQSILFKQMTETPPPITELRPDVPPALAAVLARALAKKPEDRFQTMDEFAAALPSDDPRGGASPRQTLDMRARVAIARTTLRRWKWAAVAAAVVGAAGTWTAFRATEPPTALQVAGAESDAVFAAKSALPGLRDVSVHTDLLHADSVYRFIYTAVGSRPIADSIAATVGVWRWAVTGPLRVPRMMAVEVGAGGHVIAQEVTWADSIKRPTVSADSARALANASLREHGWAPAALTFESDSTVNGKSRADHVLRWTAAKPIATGPTGAAVKQIEVRVHGDSANYYRETVVLPPNPAHDRELAAEIAVGVTTLAGCVLAVLAVVLIVKRSRIDELQWRSMLVLTLAFGIPATLYTAVVAGYKDRQGASGFLVALLFGLLGAFILLPAVVAESVLSEHRPRTVSGLGDMARGRPLIPEMATAALIAYPVAFCLRALNGWATVIEQAVDKHAALGDAGSILATPAAALTPLLSLGTGWCVALVIAFGVALLLLRPWPRWIALVLPAVLTFLFMMATTTRGADMIVPGMDVLVLTLIFWQFGLWATVATMFILVSLEGAITLFVAGGAGAMGTAIIAAALLCVPAALGFASNHRMRTGALR